MFLGNMISPGSSIKYNYPMEDFTSFVNNAFGIQQSPSLKCLSNDHDDSNHGDDEESNGAMSATMHVGDWSPGAVSHSNLPPGGDFKMSFDNPLSHSSSPLGIGYGQQSRIRQKKKYDGGSEYDEGSASDPNERDVMYNNRHALAERLQDSGESLSIMRIAETPSMPRTNIPAYLGSSLALDVMSPAPEPQPDAVVSAASGRGARERKATPKTRGLVGYGRQAGPEESVKPIRMHSAATPTAEFLDLGLGVEGQSTCNCKKSRCLKLYCECFHSLRFCTGCKCYECENRPNNEAVRDSVIASVRERDPHAFDSRLQMDPDSNAKGHLSGCHCKRTSCLKKYCECFTLAVPCTQRCRCLKCQNNSALYEIKVSEAKYTAAMLVSAAASAIDASGGDEYLSLTNITTQSKDGTASSEDGSYDSRGGKTGRSSPDSDGQPKQSGAYGQYNRQNPQPVIPNSPTGMSLLDLAGACTEQEKHEEARDGLLALSPLRRPVSKSTPNSRPMPALPAKLDLSSEGL